MWHNVNIIFTQILNTLIYYSKIYKTKKEIGYDNTKNSFSFKRMKSDRILIQNFGYKALLVMPFFSIILLKRSLKLDEILKTLKGNDFEIMGSLMIDF